LRTMIIVFAALGAILGNEAFAFIYWLLGIEMPPWRQ
jgi:hypothetical protein